jgi:hypothetical protein
LLPEEGEWGSYSGAGDDVLRVLDDGVDLRRIGPSQVVRKVRRRKVERIVMRTSLRLIQPLHLQPHFLTFHNSKDLSQELVHAN